MVYLDAAITGKKKMCQLLQSWRKSGQSELLELEKNSASNELVGVISKNDWWTDVPDELVHGLLRGPRLGDERVRLCISRPSYSVGIMVRHFYPWRPPLFFGVVGVGG